MRLPVSISAVATMVSEPASSVLRAAAKIFRGISMARASIPPLMVRPPPASALAHAEWRHQIHDPRRVAIRHGLQLDLLVRVDRRQFFERPEPLIFGRLFTVDRQQLG